MQYLIGLLNTFDYNCTQRHTEQFKA